MSHTDTDQGELITLLEVARRSKIGLRLLREARDRGELPVYRIGKWDRVYWHEVQEWIRTKRVERRAGEDQ